MPIPEFNRFGDLPEGIHRAPIAEMDVIHSDEELRVTRERVSELLDLLARLRVTSRPEERALVSGGYRAEVERMQREVLDYLTQPATTTAARAG